MNTDQDNPYKIEADVPIPVRTRRTPLRRTIMELPVGQSFCSDVQSSSSLYKSVNEYKKRGLIPLSYRVTISPDPKGEHRWRIWRVS
jgi:hypothetical protein